jgi:hypothetical protein
MFVTQTSFKVTSLKFLEIRRRQKMASKDKYSSRSIYRRCVKLTWREERGSKKKDKQSQSLKSKRMKTESIDKSLIS